LGAKSPVGPGVQVTVFDGRLAGVELAEGVRVGVEDAVDVATGVRVTVAVDVAIAVGVLIGSKPGTTAR